MSQDVVVGPDNLAECEQVIERGLTSFVEVGQALMRIRDGKLYRAGFVTFEEYCRERWNFNRDAGTRMIRAAETHVQLDALGAPTPATESQARELSGLEPGEAQEVMEAAHKATDGRLTAKAIKEARKEYEGGTSGDAPEKSMGQQIADLATKVEQQIDRFLELAINDMTEDDKSFVIWNINGIIDNLEGQKERYSGTH